MSWRSIACVLALLTGGCHNIQHLALPEVAEAETIVLAVQQESLLVIALPATTHTSLSALEGSLLTAIFYPDTLDELQIEPGEVPSVGAGETGRPLPRRWARVMTASAASGPLSWDDSPLPSAVSDFRFALSDDGACIELGGCRTDETACAIPCPDLEELTEPALPEAPCPDGWLPDEEPDLPLELAICTAPIAVNQTCDAHEAQYGDVCQRVGQACPPGLYSAGSGNYVDGLAAAGGDGTLGAPFSSLDEAFRSAPAGATLLLAKQSFVLPVAFDQTLRLVGACPSETVLTATASVEVDTSSVTLENLTIAAEVVVPPAAVLDLQSVVSSGVEVEGLLVGNDLLVSSGALLISGGHAQLSRVALRDGGLTCNSGSFTLKSSVVRGMPGATAAGLHASSCTATITDALVRDVETTGIAIAGGRAALNRVTIANLTDSSGLEIGQGAAVMVDALYLFGVSGHGLLVTGEAVLDGTQIGMKHVAFQPLDTGPDALPNAIRLRGQSQVSLSLVAVYNALFGALQIGASKATLQDLLLIGGEHIPDQHIEVRFREDSDVDVTRLGLINSMLGGLKLSRDVAQARILDLTITNSGGAGFNIEADRNTTLQRVSVSNTTLEGLQIDQRVERNPSPVVISDLSVTGSPVTGLLFVSAASAEIHRFAVQENGVGIEIGEASKGTFRQGTVSDNTVGVRFHGTPDFDGFSRVSFRDNETPYE